MARVEYRSAKRGGAGVGLKERSHDRSRREIALTRVFEAPIGRVWDMWTRADLLPLWLTSPASWELTTCEVDLREGGRWRLAWRGEGGPELAIEGRYEEVRPPHRLVSTSSWGEGWPDAAETLVLAEEEGGTRVTQRALYESEEALDAAVGRGVREGMRDAFESLARYLAEVESLPSRSGNGS